MILASRFTFVVEGIWKNMYFHPKMARPPATYDVISRNHSYWPSLNLSQNVRKGWTTSHWKSQVLMFYPLGKKKLRKTLEWWHPTSPPPPAPLVRPRVKSPGEGRGGEVEEKMFSSLLTPYENLSHSVLWKTTQKPPAIEFSYCLKSKVSVRDYHPVKTADILQRHHWFLREMTVWETSAENTYLWRNTTQI